MRGDPNLDLVWADSGASDARGMVWSCCPVYCAATIYVHGREYTISTGGLRGLTGKELQVVKDHLQSMGLIPWKKETDSGI